MSEEQNVKTSENCDHDCGSCGSNCESRQPADRTVKQNEYSHIGHVIGIVSGKGGVGKSLVTALLATSMKKRGYRVGILDADLTGPSIPKMFGTAKPARPSDEGILPAESTSGMKFISINSLLQNDTDPVIWRGPVIANVVTQFWKDVIWGDLDYLFVDMPPGTGDVPLTVFQSLPVAGVIVVASPQQLVEMIVGKAVKMAEMMHIPVLGLVENMAYFECPNCHERHYIFGETDPEALAKQYFIDTVAQLPMDPQVAALCDAGSAEKITNTLLDPIAEKILKVTENVK